MRHPLPFAMLTCLLAFAGCNSAPSSCDSSRDCSGAGLVCDIGLGVCVECVVSGDCLGAGEICRSSVCATVTACASSRECPGQVCDRGRGYCVDCVEDLDCPGTQTCEDTVCVEPPMPCTSDRECSAMGQVCDTVRGVCATCVRDGDCQPGRVCQANACVPGSRGDGGLVVTVDAGPGPGHDAGPGPGHDAGPGPGHDAGPVVTTDGGPGALVDVMILVDATGSHRDYAQARASTIVSALVTPLTSRGVNVGVAYFADFPVGGYGQPTDRPFEGGLAPGLSDSAISTELASIPDYNGLDLPESTLQALYELTGGATHAQSIPMTCPGGREAGGCWRPGSSRVIVVLTDATAHGAPDSAGVTISPYTSDVGAASYAAARARLLDGGYHLIVHWNTDTSSTTSGVPSYQRILTDLGQPTSDLVESSDWTTSVAEVASLIRGRYGL